LSCIVVLVPPNQDRHACLPQGSEHASLVPCSNIASAVFSSPPMASVGFTEEEAAEKFDNLDLYTSSFQ